MSLMFPLHFPEVPQKWDEALWLSHVSVTNEASILKAFAEMVSTSVGFLSLSVSYLISRTRGNVLLNLKILCAVYGQLKMMKVQNTMTKIASN